MCVSRSRVLRVANVVCLLVAHQQIKRQFVPNRRGVPGFFQKVRSFVGIKLDTKLTVQARRASPRSGMLSATRWSVTPCHPLRETLSASSP